MATSLRELFVKVGMETHSAEDLQSGFVHLRDLGYSPTGVRKVAVDLSDGEETAIKLIQRGSQASSCYARRCFIVAYSTEAWSYPR